jgi:hypothetical protein
MQRQELYDKLMPIIKEYHPTEILDVMRWLIAESQGKPTIDDGDWWAAQCIIGKAGIDLDVARIHYRTK